MSKLIVNTGTLSSGGAERVLSILSEKFADNYNEVIYVLWLDYVDDTIFYPIDNRVRIVKIGQETGCTNIIRHLWWFRNFVRNEKPDIVLSFMIMINLSVMLSLLGLRYPIVVAERNDPRHFHHGAFLRKVINFLYRQKSIKGIVMQTEHNKKYFENCSLYKKTNVIYNPIDLKTIVKECNYSERSKTIVSVGRLQKQKRQDTLIKAFCEFHQTFPDYKLVIYGEGDERENLLNLVSELGQGGSISLPGRTNDVLNSIKNATMFVMTSEYEGMSNALIEAMCIGLPCISTKVSGATDLIDDGKNGFLVDVGDIRTIVDRMTTLACDNNLSISIGVEAQKVYNLLSVDVVSRQWNDFLNEKRNRS